MRGPTVKLSFVMDAIKMFSLLFLLRWKGKKLVDNKLKVIFRISTNYTFHKY